MADKDKVLKDLQAQWRMMALALSRGIVHLEAVVMNGVHQADVDPSSASVALLSLKDEITNQGAAPLAHTLCLPGGYFNDISSKCRERIAKGVHN